MEFVRSVLKSETVKGFLAAILLAAMIAGAWEAKNAYWVVVKTIRAAVKMNTVVARNDQTGEVYTYEQVMDALVLKELQAKGGK